MRSQPPHYHRALVTFFPSSLPQPDFQAPGVPLLRQWWGNEIVAQETKTPCKEQSVYGRLWFSDFI